MRSFLSLLGSLKKFFKFFLQNLIGSFLGFDIVFMGLLIGFLLFFVCSFHFAYLSFQIVDLIVKFFSLTFESAYLILHVFSFLFGLKSPSHSKSN